MEGWKTIILSAKLIGPAKGNLPYLPIIYTKSEEGKFIIIDGWLRLHYYQQNNVTNFAVIIERNKSRNWFQVKAKHIYNPDAILRGIFIV